MADIPVLTTKVTVTPNYGLLALKVAQGEVGVMEEPPGSNRGRMVDAFQKAMGLDPRGKNPWCMCFVYWCFEQVAIDLNIVNPAIKSAQCVDVWNRANNLKKPKQVTPAQAKKDPTLVKPGMIFILEIAPLTHAGHTGFIESVDYKTGIMVTVEGNSNENGSRTGDGVYRLKRRHISSINKGFIQYT